MQNLVISSAILASTVAASHGATTKVHPHTGQVISPVELLRLHGAKRPTHRALSTEMFRNMTFDEDSRDLKVRNNFYSFSWHVNDNTCMGAPIDAHGYLVNYCFNSWDGFSFIVKVNKKEGFYVELDYDNNNCQGIPTAIHDMTWYPFGECGDAGLPGATVMFQYLSDYPKPMYTGVNQYTSEMYLCDSGNFNTFNWYTSGLCGVWGDYNLMVSPCDSEGGAVFNHYDVNDVTCSGAITESFPKPVQMCSSTPADDDYLFPQENVLYSAKCETVMMM